MSRRVTISVPDDVAAQLDELPARSVSGYVTEALRMRRTSDDMRAALRRAGHREYPPDPEGATWRRAAARVDPAVRAAAIAQLAASMHHPVDQVRTELDARATSD
jgi:hypothetical protein